MGFFDLFKRRRVDEFKERKEADIKADELRMERVEILAHALSGITGRSISAGRGNGDKIIRSLIDEAVSVRRDASNWIRRFGLNAFNGISDYAVAEVYAKIEIRIDKKIVKTSQDVLKEVILRFLFYRILLDSDWEVRKDLIYALIRIDVKWVEKMFQRLKNAVIYDKKSSKGYLSPELIGFNRGWLKRTDTYDLKREILYFGLCEFENLYKLALSELEKETLKTKKILDSSIEITCSGCGRRYRFGQDALVVTAEGVFADFPAGIRVGDGNSSAPDLVAAADWDSLNEGTKQKQMSEISNIINKLREAVNRQWRCKACGKVQSYLPNTQI